MNSFRALRLLLGLVLQSTAACAGDCIVASGAHTAALVELYTSEGCSSCPPADRWLSSFARWPRHPGVVPVAFHVQYWDYLGWKDRFADPVYTSRQEAQARASGARTVYTPQVIVGGRDLPAWGSPSTFSRSIKRIHDKPSRATLEVSSHIEGDGSVAGTVTATLDKGIDPAGTALFVALTQNGLASRVSAGENGGRVLQHDFVARGLSSAPLEAGRARRAFRFKAGEEWNPARMSITTFVQDTSTGEVIQALMASLCL
jgi:hypothetical protein